MPSRAYRGGKTRPVTILVRPIVAAMAVAMELELQENDRKDDWGRAEIGYRLQRVRQETDELADEVYRSHDPVRRTPHLRRRVRSEAADACNELMFIADLRGDLDEFVAKLDIAEEE